MLRVITGVPGSGKTLYAVKCLLEAKQRGDFLITNIDGFRYADEFIDSQTQEGITKFILERDWESFAKSLEGRKIYMVLDEAQRFYSSTGMNRNTQQQMFFFLEYHRHYGANVDLITQSHRSLNSRVYGLLHEIIQISKVMGLTGEQRIRRLDPTTWELIGKDSFKRTQELFDAYQSSSVESGHQRPTNAMGRLKGQIIATVGFLLVIFAVMFYFIITWLNPDDTNHQLETHTEHTTNPLTPTNHQPATQPAPQPTNKAPTLSQPLYKATGLNLSEFVLISQGKIAGYDMTRLGYRSAVFTPQELRQIGLHYRDTSSGSGLLFDPTTQERILIFVKEDKPESKPKTDGPNPLHAIPSFDLSSFRDSITSPSPVSQPSALPVVSTSPYP